MNHCYLLAASPSYTYTLEDGSTQTIQPQQEGRCWTDGEDITAPTNAIFSADWDGSSPYLENVTGTIPAVGLPFAGWPAMDKAAFDSLQPIQPQP